MQRVRLWRKMKLREWENFGKAKIAGVRGSREVVAEIALAGRGTM